VSSKILSLINGVGRADILTAVAEDAFGGIDPIPMTDITHHIDIHRTDLIAGAAFIAFFSGRSFPYYSNCRRDFHDKRDRTKNFAEGPLFLEEVGEDDGTGKIKGIADQKPTKLPPFPESLVDVEGPIIVSGIKEHQRYQQRKDEHRPTEVGPFLRDGPIGLDRQPFQESGCPAGPPTESPAKEKRTENLGD
jgi:hypothetical protein